MTSTVTKVSLRARQQQSSNDVQIYQQQQQQQQQQYLQQQQPRKHSTGSRMRDRMTTETTETTETTNGTTNGTTNASELGSSYSAIHHLHQHQVEAEAAFQGHATAPSSTTTTATTAATATTATTAQLFEALTSLTDLTGDVDRIRQDLAKPPLQREFQNGASSTSRAITDFLASQQGPHPPGSMEQTAWAANSNNHSSHNNSHNNSHNTYNNTHSAAVVHSNRPTLAMNNYSREGVQIMNGAVVNNSAVIPMHNNYHRHHSPRTPANPQIRRGSMNSPRTNGGLSMVRNDEGALLMSSMTRPYSSSAVAKETTVSKCKGFIFLLFYNTQTSL